MDRLDNPSNLPLTRSNGSELFYPQIPHVAQIIVSAKTETKTARALIDLGSVMKVADYL